MNKEKTALIAFELSAEKKDYEEEGIYILWKDMFLFQGKSTYEKLCKC